MSDTPAREVDEPSDRSLTLVHLFKGPLYRDTHEKLWSSLLQVHAQVSDYVAVLGLQVVIDESEGYAFLRSRPVDDGAVQMPRLIARRSLSFHVSLLLALLRKRLAEFDSSNAGVRLVLNREQIVEMVRVFLAESSNEARLVDSIDSHIERVVGLGFLRHLRNEPDIFEVRRILKAFVDGQWLSDFDSRLDAYLADMGRAVGAS